MWRKSLSNSLWSSLRHVLGAARFGRWAVALAMITALPAAAVAQNSPTATPSMKVGVASLIDPAAADGFYGAAPSNGGVSLGQPRANELVALAAALKNDPDRIYQYVRNNIEITWSYGLQKGALGAMIDRSGTAFDQAMLMVELLRQAGFTASYQAGAITLNAQQFSDWTGITNATAACQLLASGGIPASVNGSTIANCGYGSAAVSTVTLAHIWVSATIGGSNYLFDPAYKAHLFKAGLNLATATGLNAGDALGAASTGIENYSQSGVPYVRNLNTDGANGGTGLYPMLAIYSRNFLAYLYANGAAAAEPEDVIGGQLIARYETPTGGLRQTSLPYPVTVRHSWTGAIPDPYRTTLRVQIDKQRSPNSTLATIINQTYFVDEIYGRKLIFDTNFDILHSANQPQDSFLNFVGSLRLLDEAGAGPNPAGAGSCDVNTNRAPALATVCFADNPDFSFGEVTLAANHPYAASANGGTTLDGTYLDTATTKSVTMLVPFTIVHGWGDTGRGLPDKWGARGDKAVPRIAPQGACETCFATFVGSEGDGRREQLASSWLAQADKAARLHAQIAHSVFTLHHALGVVSADTEIEAIPSQGTSGPPGQEYYKSIADSFDRIDVDSAISLTSTTANVLDRRAALLAIASTTEALEGSVAAQVADLPDTSSVATRFDWGNCPPAADDVVDAGATLVRAQGTPRRFYQFTMANIAQLASSIPVLVEGASATTNNGVSDNLHPTMGSSELAGWQNALRSAATDYAINGYVVDTSEDAFLGPGQIASQMLVSGTSAQGVSSYVHQPSHQRGGALLAVRYDITGDPTDIAHVTVAYDLAGGLTVDHRRFKGGGGGAQTTHQSAYDPSTAADVLKSRFVDRSKVEGVDLETGGLTYSSPASLTVGNGGFPYELSAQLIWRGGRPESDVFGPQSHIQPQAPWTTNWNNTLTVSSSGLEVMGDSDVRAAAGTVAAFLAAQDVFKATPSLQRDATGVLVNSWWVSQIAGNVVTANVGADTRQFVHLPAALPDGRVWIATGPGPYAGLTQNGVRTPYTEQCPSPAGATPFYIMTRGWDYSQEHFDVTNAHGDTQHFTYWRNTYNNPNNNYCANLHGFRLTSWAFPQSGALSITLDYGNPQNGVDQLLDVRNSLGRQINFTTDGRTLTGFNNNLAGPDARAVSVIQNTDGSTTHQDPAGAQTKFTYANAPWGYSPSGWYLLGQVFTANGLALATPLPSLAYSYDSLRRVAQVRDADALWYASHNPYQFLIANAVRGERIDPVNASYSVEYDVKQRPIELFDELGRETRVGVFDGTGALRLAPYDGRHRILGYTYPEGDRESFAYDDHNNTTSLLKTGKPGSAEETTPVTISAAWDQTWNRPLSVTDGLNHTTSFSYNPAGNVGGSLISTATQPDPDGSGPQAAPIWSFSYGAFGKPTTTTDPLQVATTNTYNSSTGDLLTTAVDTAGASQLNLVTSFAYDANGELTQVDGPRTDVADIANSVYDLDRRKTLEISADPDGSGPLPRPAVRSVYDPEGRVIESDKGSTTSAVGADFAPLESTTFIYDPLGNKLQQTVFDGTTTGTVRALTQYAYYANNLVGCEAARMNPATFAALPGACSLATAGSFGNDRITVTDYDAAGEVALVRKGFGTADVIRYAQYTYYPDGERQYFLDAKGNLSTYLYDGLNRLHQLQFPSPSSPYLSNVNDYEQYGYDAADNRISWRRRDGQTIGYSYDFLNRMTLKDIPGGTASDVYYGYDAVGRRLSALFGGTSGPGVVYTYDHAGRVLSEATNGSVFNFAYDGAGDRIQITWPSSAGAVSYAFDADNRMSGACEAITPAACAAATAAGTDDLAHGVLAAYGYDTLGRRSRITRGNGANTTYGYDGLDRLTLLSQDLAGTGNDLGLGFAYNPAGQIVSRTVTAPNAGYAWTNHPAGTANHAYDDLNRDGAIAGASGYDARGNLINTGAASYAYDVENRLLSASGPTSVVLAYDPLGRPATSTASGSTTTFGYVGDELVSEAVAGAVAHRYVPGAGEDEPLVWYKGPGTTDRRFLHADNQGSIVAWSDSTGALGTDAPYAYGPYGEPQSWSASGSRYRYTGQISIPEAGLYHYKARAYDPTRGWFLQTDPAGYDSDPDLYAYVHEDPVDGADPTGMLNPCQNPCPKLTQPGKPETKQEKTEKKVLAGIVLGALQLVPVVGELADAAEATAAAGEVAEGTAATAEGAAATAEGTTESATQNAAAGAREEGVASKSTCCFVAGTLVATKYGLRPIEKISVGDLILSRAETTGQSAYKPVVELIHRHNREIYQVTLAVGLPGGETRDAVFKTTDDHPWRSADGKWLTTLELKVGVQILRANGPPARVTGVRQTGRTAPTFNLRVADFHTYFVGEDRIWVHNACKVPSDRGGGRAGSGRRSPAQRCKDCSAPHGGVAGKQCPDCYVKSQGGRDAPGFKWPWED